MFGVFTVELAMIMDRLYGGVCYAGIDTDPELKYPKGAGRVAFSNQQSYIAAISARFVQLQHGDIDKRVNMLPRVKSIDFWDKIEHLLVEVLKRYSRCILLRRCVYTWLKLERKQDVNATGFNWGSTCIKY